MPFKKSIKSIQTWYSIITIGTTHPYNLTTYPSNISEVGLLKMAFKIITLKTIEFRFTIKERSPTVLIDMKEK